MLTSYQRELEGVSNQPDLPTYAVWFIVLPKYGILRV